jgi:hypothetical protein
MKLRNTEIKKNLFSYIVGGIKSPTFLSINTFKEQNKKINLEYINLENVYKKKDDFAMEKVLKYIDENKENLKEKNIIVTGASSGIGNSIVEYLYEAGANVLSNFLFNCSNFSILVPVAKTFAPASYRYSTIEFPIPLEAPVTIIFFSFKFSISKNFSLSILFKSSFRLLFSSSNFIIFFSSSSVLFFNYFTNLSF